MVLFLFVVMMLDINIAPLREGFIKYLPVGVAVATIIMIEMVFIISGSQLTDFSLTERYPADYSNTKALGSILYTFYVYPFEIAAVILLVAIIAAIVLTMRRRPETKYQNPTQQIGVKRRDRIRIVRMPAEEKQ
jgi:NADH-quinone oxidoreductase subunit J